MESELTAPLAVAVYCVASGSPTPEGSRLDSTTLLPAKPFALGPDPDEDDANIEAMCGQLPPGLNAEGSAEPRRVSTRSGFATELLPRVTTSPPVTASRAIQ